MSLNNLPPELLSKVLEHFCLHCRPQRPGSAYEPKGHWDGTRELLRLCRVSQYIGSVAQAILCHIFVGQIGHDGASNCAAVGCLSSLGTIATNPNIVRNARYLQLLSKGFYTLHATRHNHRRQGVLLGSLLRARGSRLVTADVDMESLNMLDHLPSCKPLLRRVGSLIVEHEVPSENVATGLEKLHARDWESLEQLTLSSMQPILLPDTHLLSKLRSLKLVQVDLLPDQIAAIGKAATSLHEFWYINRSHSNANLVKLDDVCKALIRIDSLRVLYLEDADSPPEGSISSLSLLPPLDVLRLTCTQAQRQIQDNRLPYTLKHLKLYCSDGGTEALDNERFKATLRYYIMAAHSSSLRDAALNKVTVISRPDNALLWSVRDERVKKSSELFREYIERECKGWLSQGGVLTIGIGDYNYYVKNDPYRDVADIYPHN